MTRLNSAPHGSHGCIAIEETFETAQEKTSHIAAEPADWLVLPGTHVQKISEQRNRRVVLVHSDENHDENSRCPCCGLKKLVKHGTDKQDYDDIPMSGLPVVVRVQRVGHKCGWCEEVIAGPLPSWAASPGPDGRPVTQRLIDFKATQRQRPKAVTPAADPQPKLDRRHTRHAEQRALEDAAAKAEIQRRHEDSTRRFAEIVQKQAAEAKAARERLAAEPPVQAAQSPIDPEQQELDAVRARLLGIGGGSGPRTARSVLVIASRGQNRSSHSVEVVTKRRKVLPEGSMPPGANGRSATSNGGHGTLSLGGRG